MYAKEGTGSNEVKVDVVEITCYDLLHNPS